MCLLLPKAFSGNSYLTGFIIAHPVERLFYRNLNWINNYIPIQLKNFNLWMPRGLPDLHR